MRDLVSYPLSVLSHALDPEDRRTAEFRVSENEGEYYSTDCQKTRAMRLEMLNNLNLEEIKNLNTTLSKLMAFAR